VSNEEIASQSVESKPPGIAQARSPNRGADPDAHTVACIEGIWIRRGDPVVRRDVDVLIDVETQHLAESSTELLRIVRRVVAHASVPDAGVEITVVAERKLPAVVIGLPRMRNSQHRLHPGGDARSGGVRVTRGAR